VHNSNADYYAMSPQDRDKWNSENPEFRNIPDITKHSFNVSIEVIDYKPVTLEHVIESMKYA
jgi:calcineurin-like phosphoesterase family protein